MKSRAEELELQLERGCPLCGEPLGVGLWEGPGLELEGPGGGGAVPPEKWRRIQICPFCRILREFREEVPDRVDPAAGRCPWCGQACRRQACESKERVLALEETLARLHLSAGEEAEVCPSCGGIHLPGAGMELRGLEVAFQRGAIRRGIGVWLWRGFLLGAVAGALLAPWFWEWSGVGGLASVAVGGAVVGGGAGAVLGPVVSLLSDLLRGAGRQRLS